MRLLSLQVGMPRAYGREDAEDPMDRAWTSGIAKQPVAGPVAVGELGFEGDGVADLRNHGGPEKAVLAYASEHYPAWRAELGRPDFPYGAFGENLTTEGATEASVCVGDVLAISGVRLQVSQPRQPCWKLARRWRIPDLAARVERSGRSGWYLRVLRGGAAAAGEAIARLERPHPEWTIARANAAMRARRRDPGAARALAGCPALSAEWRRLLLSVAPGGD